MDIRINAWSQSFYLCSIFVQYSQCNRTLKGKLKSWDSALILQSKCTIWISGSSVLDFDYSTQKFPALIIFYFIGSKKNILTSIFPSWGLPWLKKLSLSFRSSSSPFSCICWRMTERIKFSYRRKAGWALKKCALSNFQSYQDYVIY